MWEVEVILTAAGGVGNWNPIRRDYFG